MIQSFLLLFFDYVDQVILQADNTLAEHGNHKDLVANFSCMLAVSILDFFYDCCEDFSQNPFDTDPRSEFVCPIHSGQTFVLRSYFGVSDDRSELDAERSHPRPS